MKKTKCQHENVKQVGHDRCYTHSVATHADYENRAAHGGTTHTEECCKCGAQRDVNNNQGFVEYGPWGPDLATREAAERARRQAELREQMAYEDACMEAAGIEVKDVSQGQVLLSVKHRLQWVHRSHLQDAADQEDNGDNLVPTYRAVLRAAGELENRQMAERSDW